MILLALLAACPRAPVEPLPVAPFEAAEARAAALVPDPARNGPPLREAAAPLPPFRGVDRAVARYVGVEACAACHASAAAAWRASPHAGALATLVEAEAAFNPDCIRCHTTGFGHPGGYAGASTPALADVGCEACHGPGSAHVAAPEKQYGALPGDAAACVACHTHDTAPDFRYEERWVRIAHRAEE